MGKKIVLTTFGSYGDLHPYMALAQGLSGRGHSVVIATSAFYRQKIEAVGLEFHPVRPDIDPENRLLIQRVIDPKRGTEVILKEMLLPFIRESYVDLLEATKGADLLLTHPVTYAGPLVAQKKALPWVSTVLAPMSFFSAYDLPVFPPFPNLIRLRKLGVGVSRLLIRFARRVTRSWSEPIHRLRKEIGLPRGGDPIYEGQFSPELVLAMFSSVLASQQPDWPPNTRITGHAFYDEDDSLSPALERFLEGAPPVVFTLGTSAVLAAGDFFQESIKAVQILGRRAVMLVGKDPVNWPKGPLPEGIAAFDYAPHAKVFPRASSIVHQGGIGTTGQALRSGRPMLVAPFANDQPDNAFRVTKLGVAKTLYPRRYSARNVVRELLELLENQTYSERAAEVGRQVRSEDGVRDACDAIEEKLTG